MRTARVVGLATVTCAALALLAGSTSAKDPKWAGPVNQPPGGGTFGQATIELKVHFGRKSHGSKKFVPKSLMAKLTNVYYTCADGQIYYPSVGGGDASTKFGVTDSSSGDVDSGSLSITGKFRGRTASGTIHMENHYNDGSNHGDYRTCDSGVLSWTASAP